MVVTIRRRLCATRGSTGGEEIDRNDTGARTKEKMKDSEGAQLGKALHNTSTSQN